MIHDSAIAIRIVVALLTSLVWLVLILTLRPFKRVEFDALTIISSFTLSCVYFGVLMVKLHGDLQVSLAVFVGVPLTPEDVSATVTSTFSFIKAPIRLSPSSLSSLSSSLLSSS